MVLGMRKVVLGNAHNTQKASHVSNAAIHTNWFAAKAAFVARVCESLQPSQHHNLCLQRQSTPPWLHVTSSQYVPTHSHAWHRSFSVLHPHETVCPGLSGLQWKTHIHFSFWLPLFPLIFHVATCVLFRVLLRCRSGLDNKL